MAARNGNSNTSSSTLISWGILVILAAVALLLYLRHVSLSQLLAVESLRLQNAQSLSVSQVQEEAGVIGQTIATTPQGYALFNNSESLENYVLAMSSQTNRDIAVLDTNKRVLADVVKNEIGTTFTYDTNNEISQTLHDGSPRTFVETSDAYKKGINETVVAIKDASGKIIGALVLSSSSVPAE